MSKNFKPIYLDHNATTPLDPRVFEIMKPYFTDDYGNAASIDHKYGNQALTAVDDARKIISKAVGARPDEIVFTSGATESDNLAIMGVMEKYKKHGDHMITCTTEHEAVLSTARYMETTGKRVTYIPVDELGHINIDELDKAITDKTVLISIMAANNEIGTIHDIEKIGKLAHERNVLFHTDAAQAVGHIPIDVRQMNIDLMSFSAHKMYGPKGIGALYVRGFNPRVKLQNVAHGGGQERGIRPGTLNVPAIVGFAHALLFATKEINKDNIIMKKQAKSMLEMLQEKGALLNGDRIHRLAGNINVCYLGVDGKAIINSVSDKIAISAGSACTTQSVEPSHVLLSLGYGAERAYSSIRIGLGRYTTDAESEFATQIIVDAVKTISKVTDQDGT